MPGTFRVHAPIKGPEANMVMVYLFHSILSMYLLVYATTDFSLVSTIRLDQRPSIHFTSKTSINLKSNK